MADIFQKKILADRSEDHFAGRVDELAVLQRHVGGGKGTGNGLLLLSTPGAGASEVLRHFYDGLFEEKDGPIPFYFAFKKQDRTAEHAAWRFAYEFLQQGIAFRRDDPEILKIFQDVNELAELAAPIDGDWINHALELLPSDRSGPAFLRSCLSSPLRAAAAGESLFLMIDGLHETLYLEKGQELFDELKGVFGRVATPFVFAGRRRFLFGQMRCPRLPIESLPHADAVIVTERCADEYDVAINDQTCDLIATQFGGVLEFIHSIFQGASDTRVGLDSFQNVQKVYNDELFGGRIGRYYDNLLHEIVQDSRIERGLIEVLYESRMPGIEKASVESWRERLGLAESEFSKTLLLLNVHEIVQLSSGRVELSSENEILTDYVTSRHRLESKGDNRAIVFGESLLAFIKRAPKAMAKSYRRTSALPLRELMAGFHAQAVSAALMDYGKFADKFKGASDDEIGALLRDDTDRIVLPQIVYTLPAESIYGPLEDVIDTTRASAAMGLQKNDGASSDETIWIAAEIDSKLAATKELTEFWCDRLEIAAMMCNFPSHKIWLVTQEGFSHEALDVLRERESFGSSHRQVELLAKFLNVGSQTESNDADGEYEIVVPMGADAELIAAHTLEEIARRHNFSAKAINQIKTALVEACINASEHSLSPDQKIFQKFSVESDRINITISNRGLRLADKTAVEIEPDEGRRGWGLKLMRKLMDDVKIEETDDGTTISMTKYLAKEASA